MGDKYLPTDRDLKATKRYHDNRRTQSKFIPSAPRPAPKPSPAPAKKDAPKK